MHFVTFFAPFIAGAVFAAPQSEHYAYYRRQANTCSKDDAFLKVTTVAEHRIGYCSAFLNGSHDRRSLWDVTEVQISSVCSCLPSATPAANGTAMAPTVLATPSIVARR